MVLGVANSIDRLWIFVARFCPGLRVLISGASLVPIASLRTADGFISEQFCLE